MKRNGHHHGAAHKRAGAPHKHAGAARKKEKADVATLLVQRDTLAFNAEFDEITQFDKVVFSAAQFTNLNPLQKTEKFWLPKYLDTSVPPAQYFFEACMRTETGQVFRDAVDGKNYTDSEVTLINKWGTFGTQYGNFQPWKWSEEGIMAVSCQIFSIKKKDVPKDKSKMVDMSKFVFYPESSSQMITNMRANGWTVTQVAKPSHTRGELEVQIQKNKKKTT